MGGIDDGTVLTAVRAGVQNGLRVGFELLKVIVPVALAVAVLEQTPALEALEALLAPVMGWVGLPAEAAVVLALGNLLNLYAAIGAMVALSFTPHETLALAVMLGFSHNLLVESAVVRKIGVSMTAMAVLRLGLAFAAAAVMQAWA